MDEQVTLVDRAEAVELQGVLAHVEICLDSELIAVASQHRRRRLDQVADAVHVEHETGAREPRPLPPQARDHATAARGAVAWQIATASASAACWFLTSMPRTSFTMRCTCAFSACP